MANLQVPRSIANLERAISRLSNKAVISSFTILRSFKWVSQKGVRP
jgi:hypothetical protein